MAFSFGLRKHGTNTKQEVLAGLTIFFSMAYIAALMPSLLQHIGMPTSSVFVSTILVCIVGSLLMALIANLPIAIGPAVATIAYFASAVATHSTLTWQSGISALIIAAIALFIATCLRVQVNIAKAIPEDFFSAICSGLGLFLVVIALSNASILQVTHKPLSASFLTWGPSTWLFLVSAILSIAFDKLRISGAFILAILITTGIAFIAGLAHYHGLFALPSGIHLSFLQANWQSLHHTAVWETAFCIFLITLFDNTGTLLGLLQLMNRHNTNPKKSGFSRGVMANALSTLTASALASPSTSTYLESAGGIRAGGKTGLTTLVVAVGFVLLLFFSPFVLAIPKEASSGVLFYIGCIMLRKIKDIHWKEWPCTIGCLITALVIPITYSVANGIAAGLVAYTLMSCFTRHRRQQFLYKSLWVTSVLAIFVLVLYRNEILRII